MNQGSLLTEDLPFEVMRRSWQPVALARDLPEGAVIGFRLLDREIVAARLPEGLLAAEVACPHKGMRLSSGTVCGGELQCPYHGWRFDGRGRCMNIPSLLDASPGKLESANLKTFGVAERYGMVWVQLEPDEEASIPEVPEFENGEWELLLGPPTVFRSGFRREIENFLDMTHFAFAHASTLGQAAEPRVPEMEIELVETPPVGFTMRTEFPAVCRPGETPAKLSSGHSRYYRTFLPNFTIIRQSWPDGDERILLHVPTPNTRESCTVFWALGISPGFVGPPPEAQLEFSIRVLEEDRRMCENQIPPEIPISPSRGGWGVLVTPGDTLANTFQRCFRRYLVGK